MFGYVQERKLLLIGERNFPFEFLTIFPQKNNKS